MTKAQREFTKEIGEMWHGLDDHSKEASVYVGNLLARTADAARKQGFRRGVLMTIGVAVAAKVCYDYLHGDFTITLGDVKDEAT